MLKLEFRHSKVGDTAFKFSRGIDTEEIKGLTVHKVYKAVFKALIRETYLNGIVKKVNMSAIQAEMEIEKMKIDPDFILWFVDRYINQEKFRECVTTYFTVAWYAQDTALPEFKKMYESDDTGIWGKIANGVEAGYSERESYIIALLTSMLSYLYASKESYYRRLSISKVIRNVMSDLYIVESRGYYWQTCGERVDGIGSKLKVPNLKDIQPMNMYDVDDVGYGIVNSSDVVSIYTTGVLTKIATLKDLSKSAYSEYIDIALSEDTYDALEEDFTLFEIFSDYVDACLRYTITDEGLPVLKSFMGEKW